MDGPVTLYFVTGLQRVQCTDSVIMPCNSVAEYAGVPRERMVDLCVI